MSTTRDFLASIIDYAGLFPPAELDMAASVAAYADERRREFRWALGRFVVPASRLEEFDRAAPAPLRDPWTLSVIAGPDLDADLRTIAAFRRRRRDAEVASVEFKISTPDQVRVAGDKIDGDLEPFYEIPVSEPPDALLGAIAREHGRAKIRTGSEAPSTADLVRFLAAAAKAGVGFKATAGLHHPLRTDSQHGFLNLFLTAAFLKSGMDPAEAALLMEERAPTAFTFDERAASWHGKRIDRASLVETRRSFALSFGSCSFREPIDALREMRLL